MSEAHPVDLKMLMSNSKQSKVFPCSGSISAPTDMSAEIENLAMGHPAVSEAAVVAVPNAKWGERPLLVVVLKATSAQDQMSLEEGPIDNESIKEQLFGWVWVGACVLCVHVYDVRALRAFACASACV